MKQFTFLDLLPGTGHDPKHARQACSALRASLAKGQIYCISFGLASISLALRS